jgi:hypothetical protein
MKFEKLVQDVLQENNVMGGPSSVMGPNVGKTASVVSGDNWNTGDQRIAKSLYGGVITRNGMKSYGKKKKKKN